MKHDRDVFGADRRVVLEMCRPARRPEYAWAIGDGGIDGYLFGRRGYSFEQLGPLVARDESMARVLAPGVPVCPCGSGVHHRHADLRPVVAWLVSAGFTRQRPFTRMHRGNRPFRERVNQMFAIAGPEFG